MEYGESRDVFILPSNSVPFQEVVDLDERLHAAVPNLHVFIAGRGQNANLIAMGGAPGNALYDFEEWADPISGYRP
jgi:hypothetical protein